MKGQAPLEAVQRSLSATSNDHQTFELDQYRARVAKYLDEKTDNRVFFDSLQFAYDLHAGQRRKSGAPYISHPCSVAEILARELRFQDPLLLSAALLHDVVEDIPSITLDDIEKRFGVIVAELVDGCTKLTRRHLDRATVRDLTHSKIFLSASRRLGVLIIKLADRLHNLRTLHYLAQSKRQRIAQETVEVYAPIAARFNIFPLKRELYHLALSYLYPRKSKRILQFTRELRSTPEFLEMERKLREIFSNRPFQVMVRSRTKGLGSYYNHLKRTLDLSNAENHVDFAIIIQSDNLLDCYAALGIVNTTFSPIPRSLRDFIANPKNNGYRSLHVRIHETGQNYLIKIRTPDMDEWAMYGILREWNAQKPLSDEHWQEVSELLRSIGEYGGAGSQRRDLIRLSETEEIFVHSPKGDIYYLPKGSIVLDFAYRIHSELGDFCAGAMVNFEWAEPTRVLADGDVVEIINSPEPLDVDPDLETACKTPKARTAINRHLQQKRRRYAQDVGRQIVLQELNRHGIAPDTLEGESVGLMLELLNLKDLSELYARVGQDLLSPHLVLYYIEAPSRDRSLLDPNQHRKESAFDPNVVVVGELDKGVHKFARCCYPYPGQSRVVATLSERGMTFHHMDCGDLIQRHDLEPQRLVSIKWSQTEKWSHSLVFSLLALDETLEEVIQLLAQPGPRFQVLSLTALQDKHDQPCVRLQVELHSFSEAAELFNRLEAVQIVIEAYGRARLKDIVARNT